jgi:hypothetical protein
MHGAGARRNEALHCQHVRGADLSLGSQSRRPLGDRWSGDWAIRQSALVPRGRQRRLASALQAPTL